MSPDAWTNTELDYETLRIPLFSQPDNEGKCLVYSIWMVQNYIANLYPVDWVQDSTPGLEISEIEEELTLRDSGWLMREDELASLSEKTGAVRYRLREDETSHPIETFDSMLREKLEDKDLPTIVIYDVYYFIHGVPNGGPLHAALFGVCQEMKLHFKIHGESKGQYRSKTFTTHGTPEVLIGWST